MAEARDPLDVERIVVLSPHLDDAALSLGATIARASRAGRRVTVVTVLAGDPDTDARAGEWDELCGFSSAAEAVRARRAEDRAACDILGAEAVWLPYGDEQHGRGADDEEVWAGLEPLLGGVDLVLAPGYPLQHADHGWLAKLLLERSRGLPVALYAEQPYAANVAIGRGYSLRPLLRTARLIAASRAGRRPFQAPAPADLQPFVQAVAWRAIRPTRVERRLKERAIRAYSSQFGVDRLGRRLLTRIRLYELAVGGEQVAPVAQAPRAAAAV